MSIKGQVSTELIVIIAAIMVIFIPLLITVYIKAGGTEEDISMLQAQLASTRIANMINSIGKLGEGSSIILEVYLPKNTEKISFSSLGHGSEVTITVRTDEGVVDLSETAKFNVEVLNQFDNIGSGKIKMEITSEEEIVTIKKKS